MGMCMSHAGEGSWESEKILLGGKKTSTSAADAAAMVVSMKGGLREYKVPIVVSQVLQTEYSISTCSSPSSSCKNNINDDDDDRKGYFICNSDLLLYDEYIPAMDSNAHLHPNILYFVLPTSKLNYRLSASDMAALAVKATLALQSTTQLITTNNNNIIVMNKKKKKKKKINQISPVMIMNLSDTNTRPSDHHHHHDVDVDQDNIDCANDDHHHAIYDIKRLDANPYSHINCKPASSYPRDYGIRVGYSPRSASSNFGFLKHSSSSLRRPKQLSTASNSYRLRLTTIYEGIVLF